MTFLLLDTYDLGQESYWGSKVFYKLRLTGAEVAQQPSPPL